jgi:hypothetical protein
MLTSFACSEDSVVVYQAADVYEHVTYVNHLNITKVTSINEENEQRVKSNVFLFRLVDA